MKVESAGVHTFVIWVSSCSDDLNLYLVFVEVNGPLHKGCYKSCDVTCLQQDIPNLPMIAVQGDCMQSEWMHSCNLTHGNFH